jgi:hypothetical protein
MLRLLVGVVLLVGSALSATYVVHAQRSTVVPALSADASRGTFDPAASVGLFVGIRTFQNADEFAEVPYAVDDAVDLAYMFSSTLRLVTPQRVRLALSGEPQKPESITRLAELRAQGAVVQQATYTTLLTMLSRAAGEVDTAGALIVSMATHGENERLMAADTSKAEQESTSMAVSLVLQRVGASKAGRRLVLLDACREIREPGRRGDDPTAAMSSRFADALANARGTVVIAATTTGGFSYDDPARRNGVFTGALLDGLSGEAPSNTDGFVTIETLKTFVNQRVTAWVTANRPRDSVSRGVTLTAEPITLEQMPLAEHPQRRVRAREQELTWARGILTTALTSRYPEFSGAMFDEISTRLTLPGAVLEELFGRLKLLETNGAAYASDFALWWRAKGSTDTLPGGAGSGGPAVVPVTGGGGAAAARLLSLPGLIEGALESTDSALSAADRRLFDEYRFRGRRGQGVRIEVEADFDGFLLLLNAQDRQTIAEDDDSGDGVDPRIVVPLPADGEFAILVTTYRNSDQSTGPYLLRIAEASAAEIEEALRPTPDPDPPPRTNVTWTPANGPRLRFHPSNTTRGNLATNSRRIGERYGNEYRLQGSAGQRIRVTMEAQVDGYLMLFSADGQRLIAEDDDGGDASNPLLEVELPDDGVYLLVVTTYDDRTTGNYSIRVQLVLPDGIEVGGGLDAGDERTDDKYLEQWVFEGNAGQRVRIEMNAAFDTVVKLLRDRQQLQENDDANADTTNSVIEFTLPATGTYTVIATSYAESATGAYTLRLTTP